MVSEHGLRPRWVGLVGVVVLVLALVVLRVGGLSPAVPGWPASLVVLLMAAVVVGIGVPVRRLRQGRATRPVSPLWAARALVLGQAAALTGAALAGWYAAQALLLVPDADVDSQRARVWVLTLLAAVSVGLAVAGLLAQRMCRIDEDPRHPAGDEDDEVD